MIRRKATWAQVDEAGRLLLPPELIKQYGLEPGSQVRIDNEANSLHLSRPVSHLAKLYIEPTSLCNLTCRMCIRNVINEPQGHMAESTFARIIADLRERPSPPVVFFGGFGEPLTHPQIIEMVSQAKTVASSVELITNGILLTEEYSRQLIDAGLDILWVSIDGVTPESYSDIRIGDELPTVLENIAGFQALQRASHKPKTEIGIAFVAMERNIQDLPKLLSWSTRLGASYYMVTNVLPYTADMCQEVLYRRTLDEIPFNPSMWAPRLKLPRMDWNETTREPLYRLIRSGKKPGLNGDDPGKAIDRCPFIEKGATAIAWNGGISPCLPLLHDHISYSEPNRKRTSKRYVVGNLSEHSLSEIWNEPEYVAFRQRVQTFDFSPCTVCGGCDLSEANEEDCFGNAFPTCGGCLWAQGVIQCP